jgi:hypothetical protein
MINDKEWVILIRTDPKEGEVIRGKLEVSGIKARLEQESVGKILGFTLNGLGEVKVYVPSKSLEEAKRILKE